jgi:hypothetical protein
MDSITPVAFEMAAAAAQPSGVATAAAAGAPTVFDLANFHAAYASAAQTTPQAVQAPKVSGTETGGFHSVMVMLQGLNGDAESIGTAALQNKSSQARMTPGDMLAMTTQAYEFLFHCEVTSNVANRTSEGVQQLFQQQS